MALSPPLRVLVVGGGVAATEAVLALHAHAQERVVIDWLVRRPFFSYRPLAVAAPFGLGEVHHVDLIEIAERHGARLQVGRLAAIDDDRGEATLENGRRLRYDACLLAVGAVASESVQGALSFRGEPDIEGMRDLLDGLDGGGPHRIAFVAPPGVPWTLPVYELALLTAAHTLREGIDAELWLITAEARPLAVFGATVARCVTELLDDRGIHLRLGSFPDALEDGLLFMPMEGALRVDEVVALPRVVGRTVSGVPHDASGFVPTRADGTVIGCTTLFAAGDMTNQPIKQGGLAAQQAEVAARTIAHRAGAAVTLGPDVPVLRGLLLTGAGPVFFRRVGSRPATVSEEPLWWPAGKLFGQHLSAELARAQQAASPTA